MATKVSDLPSATIPPSGTETISIVQSGQSRQIALDDIGVTGPQGPQGPAGNDGADGADGQGVPIGGTTSQVLSKIDNTDHNTEWRAESVVSVATKIGAVSLDHDDIAETAARKAFTTAEQTKLAGIATGAQVNTVDSVAGKTGAVTLTADDMTDGVTNKVFTAAEQTKLGGIATGAQVNTVNSVATKTGAVVLDADDIGDGVTNRVFTNTEKTKLTGIETGAQVNTVDSVAGKTGAVTLDGNDITEVTDKRFMSDAQETKLDGINTSALNPSGGTTGQVLKKIDGTDYNYSWQADEQGSGTIPNGGTTDQVLAKVDNTDQNVYWKDDDTGSGAPSGGSAGQVLKKDSATDFDFSWQDDNDTTYSVFTTGNVDGLAPGYSGAADVNRVLSQNGTWIERVVTVNGVAQSGNGITIDADNISDGSTNVMMLTAERAKLTGIETGAQVNTVDDVAGKTGNVTLDADDVAEVVNKRWFLDAERTKLTGVENNAQVNTVDSVNTQTGEVVLDTGDVNPVTDRNYVNDSQRHHLDLSAFGASGVVSGLTISVGTDPNTQYNITAGTYWITDPTDYFNTSNNAEVIYPGVTNQTRTLTNANEHVIIMLDIAGAITEKYLSNVSSTDFSDFCIIGEYFTDDSGNIQSIGGRHFPAQDTRKLIMDYISASGSRAIVTNGILLSNVAANLQIQHSSGTIFYPGGNYQNNVKDPNHVAIPLENPITFDIIESDGTVNTADTQTVPNDLRENPIGTTTTVRNGRFAMMPVWGNIDGHYYLQACQIDEPRSVEECFSSLDLMNSHVFPPQFNRDSVYLGLVCLLKSGTDLSSTTAAVFIGRELWTPVNYSGGGGSSGGQGTVQSVNNILPDSGGNVTLDSDDITQGSTNLFLTSAERTKLTGIETGAQVNDVDSVNSQTGAVVLDTGDISEVTDSRYMSDAQETKLDTLLTAAQVPAGGTAGQVLEKIDATDHNMQWATPGGGAPTKVYKSFVMENPTATENRMICMLPVASTIARVRVVSVGTTPSLDFNLAHGPDRSSLTNVFATDQTTTNTTTGDTYTTFASASLAADDWLVLTTSAQSGTVDEFSVHIEYDL